MTLPPPPETRNSTPVEPVSEPVPKFDVPVTLVRLIPFAPPEELTDEKFAFSETPLAMIAGAASGVLLTVPVLLVTVIVPPPVAERPVPAFVSIVRELKVMAEVALLLARLTPVPPAAVRVALTLCWKLTAVLAARL